MKTREAIASGWWFSLYWIMVEDGNVLWFDTPLEGLLYINGDNDSFA